MGECYESSCRSEMAIVGHVTRLKHPELRIQHWRQQLLDRSTKNFKGDLMLRLKQLEGTGSHQRSIEHRMWKIRRGLGLVVNSKRLKKN